MKTIFTVIVTIVLTISALYFAGSLDADTAATVEVAATGVGEGAMEVVSWIGDAAEDAATDDAGEVVEEAEPGVADTAEAATGSATN